MQRQGLERLIPLFFPYPGLQDHAGNAQAVLLVALFEFEHPVAQVRQPLLNTHTGMDR